MAKFKPRCLNLPRHPNFKQTVIFDLDETLVHCTDNLTCCDKVLTLTLPTGLQIVCGINVRPYALECLQKAASMFEVIVYTASHQSYADVVLDFLDPNGQYISHRLYREHCVYSNGLYLKDIRVTGRDLRKTVLIDNSVYSFAFQMLNGVPILTWFEDAEDSELFKVMEYLDLVQNVRDVRKINSSLFKIKKLMKFFNKNKENYASNVNQYTKMLRQIGRLTFGFAAGFTLAMNLDQTHVDQFYSQINPSFLKHQDYLDTSDLSSIGERRQKFAQVLIDNGGSARFIEMLSDYNNQAFELKAQEGYDEIPMREQIKLLEKYFRKYYPELFDDASGEQFIQSLNLKLYCEDHYNVPKPLK